jgi:hypothetical protein
MTAREIAEQAVLIKDNYNLVAREDFCEETYNVNKLIDIIEDAVVKGQQEMMKEVKEGVYKNTSAGEPFVVLGIGYEYKQLQEKFVITSWFNSYKNIFIFPYDDFVKYLREGVYEFVRPGNY